MSLHRCLGRIVCAGLSMVHRRRGASPPDSQHSNLTLLLDGRIPFDVYIPVTMIGFEDCARWQAATRSSMWMVTSMVALTPLSSAAPTVTV